MRRLSQQLEKVHIFFTWKLVPCFLLGLKINDWHSLFFQYSHSKLSMYYIVSSAVGKKVECGYRDCVATDTNSSSDDPAYCLPRTCQVKVINSVCL